MLTSNPGHPVFLLLLREQRLGKFLCYTWRSEKSLEAAQKFQKFHSNFETTRLQLVSKIPSLPSTMKQGHDNLSNDEQDDLKSATLLEVTA